jgi:hypothetical protein
MEVYKNKPTAGIVGDVLFNQSVYGTDASLNQQEFTRITHTIRDATSGGADGSIEMGCFVNGTYANFVQLNAVENEVNFFKVLDMSGNNIRTSTGNLTIDTSGSSGTGNINLNAKQHIQLIPGTAGDIIGLTSNGNVTMTANEPGGTTNGFCILNADRGVSLTSALGGSNGNIILDVNNIGDLQLEGTTLESGSVGLPVSKFLRIKLNGTFYKIQLYADV